MNPYVRGVDAARDLGDIWDYIAADKREGLTTQPVLFLAVGAYLIIYRSGQHPRVEIVAVTEGSRDIPAFLRRRFQ